MTRRIDFLKLGSSLKVRQSRNVFFKPTILPKNEKTNLFFLPLTELRRIVFVRFLEEFDDTENCFRDLLIFSSCFKSLKLRACENSHAEFCYSESSKIQSSLL